ncbi:Uncharacterized protein GBIM_09521 [Gryllus bimaculatus]|nr:Uncharacterized protein GBIM_09521 [Gryllus bimaculatus]
MDQSGTSPPEALPKWLTEEYFRSLFRRKSPGEEVAVQNVTVKFADEERVHGRLIRVAVDVATPAGAKTLSYIVKRPAPGQFASTPASANMYRMEALVLGEIIPAMEKVLEAVAPGKFEQLAPRLVDYGLDENRFIMTEDLSVVGFSTGNRQIGLDLEHSLAYVNHLAAFHAASVAVMDRYESEIKAIPLLIDSEEVKFLNEFIATSMKGVESAIDSWEEGSKYAHQVRTLGASLPSRLALANRAGEGLAVLCHGDMFVNNILFRGGAGGPAVRLVDFQLSRVGSFADDLAGFLVSAVDDDVLRSHWERVGEQYRGALNAALLALGHGARALSQEAVRDAMRAQRAVAQFALFHMLPRSRAPAAVHLHAAGPAFHAPAYRALLALLLPRFRALGWLDEFHNAEVNHKNRIPSWLNRDYFQLLLQQQSTGADLQVEGVHVTKPGGKSSSTTDFFQAAVGISIPSGVETEFFVLRCPGNVVFAKMPAKSCMLEMEIPALGKQISAAEKGTASGIKSSQSRSLLDRRENSRYYTHKKIQVKTVFHHKTPDLKFCLAVIHLLAILHVASMIATGGNNSKISDIATSPFLKEYITTSIKTIFPHLATLQTEQKEEENGPSETRDERVLLDSQEAIVKSDEIQLDTQKTTQEYSAEKERKLNAVANERIRRDSHSSKYRLNEGEQRHEQDVSKFNNIGHKINKTISRASYVNELSYQSERVDARGNTTEPSEESFPTIPRLSDLTSSYQERREDLQRRLGAHFPVDRVSFFRVTPQASPSKKVYSHNTKNSSVVSIKLPRLRQFVLNERFLSTFHTSSFVHIYT